MTVNAYGRDVTEEAKRIRALKTWPRWPWLPLKRKKGPYDQVELGLIYADHVDLPHEDRPAEPLVVWNAPWMPSMKAAIAITMGATPPWPIVGEYVGVEQLLEDGWVVD
jgi:hypothetical protein